MDIRDLFRPKWKHSNTAVRLAAVADIKSDQPELLAEIVKTDESPEVRAAAADRINDLTLLEQLHGLGLDSQTASVIQEKLDDAAFKSALDADQAEERERQMLRIADERRLADLILETDDVELRLKTLARIESEPLLVHVATHKCGKDAGCAAVARIMECDHLEKVSNSGSNKTVRRAAAVRQEKLYPPAGPDPDEQRNSELAELARHAQELKDSWNFAAVADLLAADEARWQELDPDRSHHLALSFQTALDHFAERREKFEAQQAAEKARLAAVEQEAAEKESLCRAMAELDPQADDAREKWQALVEQWEGLEPLSVEAKEDELQQGFEAARTQARARQEAVNREKEQLAELEGRLTDLEALRESEDWQKIESAVAAAEAESSSFEQLDVADLLARLKNVRASLTQRLADHQDEVRAAAEQRRKRLQELLDAAREQCHPDNHRNARQRINEIKDEWHELDGNADREFRRSFKEILDRFYEGEREYRQEREWAEWHNKTEKEKLIAAVEACDDEEDLPKVANLIKGAQARWKQIGPVPRADSQPMWLRFHDACDRNFSRCKAFFEEQRQERNANLEKALVFCEEAESIQDSAEWRQTANRLKQLQVEWKELGSLPRAAGQKAYQRFRAACDHFFERQRQHFEELDSHREENQKKKEAIIAKVEGLVESEDELHAGDCIDLQNEWKSVGPALHEDEPKLWSRFRDACDKFFDRLDAERESNREAKIALCQKVEKIVAELTEDSDRSNAAREIIATQRQWKEIGPAPRNEEQELWARFRVPCDEFFEARRAHYREMADERERHLAEKEDLVMEAESVADSSDWRETAQLLKELQRRWKEIGPAPRDREQEVWNRFHAACDQFFERRRKFYESQDKKRLDNLKEKETLLTELELLVGAETPSSRTDQGLSLAEEIELAIETNSVLASDHQSTFDEVRRIQDHWKRIGPVPHEVNRQLWQRYRELLDTFYGDLRDQS